jgi:putative two-component system response regulator
MRRHTELGAKILDAGRSPILELGMKIALTHHERWDGTGYPLGLAGKHIPIEGRITSVADVFDALSSKRPYKPAFPLEKCFAIMREGRGTQFDREVLDAFFARQDDIVRIQITHADVE